MSLKYAILSMVINKEKSGYDIAKEFKSTINFFWQASHQQIYKTLATLEDANWVKYQIKKQQDKPDKKTYSITEVGRNELAKWVAEPSKAQTIRNELLVKLLSIETVGIDIIIKELQRYSLKIKQQLEIYNQIVQEHYQCEPESLPSLYYMSLYLTVRKGIIWAKSEIDWLNESIDLLQKRQKNK